MRHFPLGTTYRLVYLFQSTVLNVEVQLNIYHSRYHDSRTSSPLLIETSPPILFLVLCILYYGGCWRTYVDYTFDLWPERRLVSKLSWMLPLHFEFTSKPSTEKLGWHVIFGSMPKEKEIKQSWPPTTPSRILRTGLDDPVYSTGRSGFKKAMVPCLEQPYAGFRHKLCQMETPSQTDIRSS